ncbi:hypothetical protein BJ742DRAFT_855728 [Cladochytrium replicatum]|nr:hypothetical protein BJ742DRAFT_855728 [Cladochytrium replicatum]
MATDDEAEARLAVILDESGARGANAVAINDFPVTGRGLKILADTPAGSEILYIPKKLQWTEGAAKSHKIFGHMAKLLPSREILPLFILFIQHHGTQSGMDRLRSLHVQLLPQTYSASYFFTEEDLADLPSELKSFTESFRAQIRDDYSELRTLIKSNEAFEVFKSEWFTLKKYAWARFTVDSRCMDFRSDTSHIRTMVPLVDMLNHSFEHPCLHQLDPVSQDVRIVSTRDYKAGEQIFINYGPFSNSKFLRTYGFVIQRNPFESVQLELSMSPAAPLFIEKLRILKDLGMSVNCAFPLSLQDPLPISLLEYLRICRLTAQEAARVSKDDLSDPRAWLPVSKRNEREVLGALDGAVDGLLGNYTINLSGIETLLEQPDTVPPGSNRWASLVACEGEQEALLSTKKALDRLLGRRCTNCGKPSSETRLLKCGKCGEAAYCSPTCQRADWSSHKVRCARLT